MTDLGKTAGTPPKPVRQSKRAHWLAIAGLLLIVLSGPLAKAGVFSPMLGMLGYTIASLLLFIALIIGALALFGDRNSNVLQNSWTTWLVVALGVGVTGLNVATINGSRFGRRYFSSLVISFIWSEEPNILYAKPDCPKTN